MASNIGRSTELEDQSMTEIDEGKRVRKLVVAIDGSEESDYALQWMLKHIYRCGDKVHLLYVKSPISSTASVSLLSAPDVVGYLREKDSLVAKSVTERCSGCCGKFNVEPHVEIISGEPRQTICKVVASEKSDLLVVGCRGLTGVKRAILGSVSDHCIHNAQCPVIVVKKNT